MELLVANITGKIRRERLNNKEYIVAPMSLISPGVLNGSKGPLYYPIEEISKSVDVWNHIPLVVYHPTINGQPVTARDPEVLATQGIGFVFRSKANGKLTAEGWFDVEATQRVDNRVLDSLEAGKPIELSTGLFTENEPASEGATFNNIPYTHVAKNYKADHVAILPDEKGACSLGDGCGVLINEKGERIPLDSTKTSEAPQESNTNPIANEEISMAKKQLIDELISNCSCWKEDDREVLNQMDDEKVQGFIDGAKQAKKNKDALTANTTLLEEGFEDEHGLHAFNVNTGKWEHAPKKEKTPKEPVANQESQPKTNPQTDEEWLAAAPNGIRTVVQNAMNFEAEQRKELCEKIVSNEENDEAKVQLHKALNLDDKPLSELKVLANKLGKKEEPTHNHRPSYFGGSGGGSINPPKEEKEEPLGLPVYNWAEMAKH